MPEETQSNEEVNDHLTFINNFLTAQEFVEALRETNPEVYNLIYNVGYSVGHVEGCQECLGKVNNLLVDIYNILGPVEIKKE